MFLDYCKIENDVFRGCEFQIKRKYCMKVESKSLEISSRNHPHEALWYVGKQIFTFCEKLKGKLFF